MMAIVFFDDVDVEGVISRLFSPMDLKILVITSGSLPGLGWLDNAKGMIDEMIKLYMK